MGLRQKQGKPQDSIEVIPAQAVVKPRRGVPPVVKRRTVVPPVVKPRRGVPTLESRITIRDPETYPDNERCQNIFYSYAGQHAIFVKA